MSTAVIAERCWVGNMSGLMRKLRSTRKGNSFLRSQKLSKKTGSTHVNFLDDSPDLASVWMPSRVFFFPIENIHVLFFPVHSSCVPCVDIVLDVIHFVNKIVNNSPYVACISACN
ncbi:Uncharacterized protein TCM_015670 [Theobroma cacao]|uniref:Uncharacterized protein n=1 Tax=Theobroma cacao TaxID=3641 RepID=A0A061GA52_THECC|nr:Uncharacterized protein TCM_015670 [Theobroma cacao]